MGDDMRLALIAARGILQKLQTLETRHHVPRDRYPLADGDCHYLYFVQPLKGGPIKIGITNNPNHRLAGLQNGSPLPLVLRRVIELENEGTARALEAALHERFALSRIHGEWFDPTPDVAEMAHTGTEQRREETDSFMAYLETIEDPEWLDEDLSQPVRDLAVVR